MPRSPSSKCIFDRAPATWQELQQFVAQAFREMGCDADVERTIEVPRGTVTVDVAVRDDMTVPPSIYICECKHWRRRVSKSEVHAFRTVLAEIGANRGLLISSAGFQAGAVEATKFTNVDLLSWSSFESTYFERWSQACGIRLGSHMRKVFSRMDNSDEHLWDGRDCSEASFNDLERIAQQYIVLTYWKIIEHYNPIEWLEAVAKFAPEDSIHGRLDTARKLVDAIPSICARATKDLNRFWSSLS